MFYHGFIFVSFYLLFKDEWHRVTRRSIRKTASVGTTEILECDIDYPDGVWTDHIITWKKQVTGFIYLQRKKHLLIRTFDI